MLHNKIYPLSLEVSGQEFIPKVRQSLLSISYEFQVIDKIFEKNILNFNAQNCNYRVIALENHKGIFRLQRHIHSIYIDTNTRRAMAMSCGIFDLNCETTFSRLEAHRLLRDIIALILTLDGKIVLHGNLLSFHDGQAFAILGESGQGKSTLSLALAKCGAQFISDDICAFEKGTGRVLFGTNTLNVSPTTYRALCGETSLIDDNEKLTIQLESNRELTGEYYLKSIYKLASASGEQIFIENVQSAKAVYEYMKCSLFDPREIGMSLEEYALERAAMQKHIPLQEIHFPRNFAQLSEVSFYLHLIQSGS